MLIFKRHTQIVLERRFSAFMLLCVWLERLRCSGISKRCWLLTTAASGLFCERARIMCGIINSFQFIMYKRRTPSQFVCYLKEKLVGCSYTATRYNLKISVNRFRWLLVIKIYCKFKADKNLLLLFKYIHFLTAPLLFFYYF